MSEAAPQTTFCFDCPILPPKTALGDMTAGDWTFELLAASAFACAALLVFKELRRNFRPITAWSISAVTGLMSGLMTCLLAEMLTMGMLPGLNWYERIEMSGGDAIPTVPILLSAGFLMIVIGGVKEISNRFSNQLS